MAQLLIVEDDSAIRTALCRTLADRGHGVTSAATATSGLALIASTSPDLVVLDLGLPDMDGLVLLRMLRAVNAVPVIAATARDDERAIVAVLDAGADDYLIKPFSSAQLDARIRAVLRRVDTDSPQEPLSIGGLRISPLSRDAQLDDALLTLTAKEFDLLLYLVERAGQVVTKRELLTQIWGQPFTNTDKTIDVHLSWLRRKLGESGQSPRYLQTVRGVGVKLVDPGERSATGTVR